jgi:hypothetical protein
MSTQRIYIERSTWECIRNEILEILMNPLRSSKISYVGPNISVDTSHAYSDVYTY